MALQNLTVTVGADISGLTSGLREAGQRVADFTQRTEAGFQALGTVGKIATGAGLAIAGGLGFAVKSAADFDSAIRKAGAIAGASADEFENMKQAALQLGATTSQSASSAAEAMTELAAKGFDANQVIAAMPGIISAAEASGEDLALTADAISSALNIWSLNAKESSRVADVLAMSANVSAAGISDLSYVMKYAGAPAAALGISLEEVAAAAGVMTNAGLDGSSAGTSLRASLLALNNPAKAQEKIMNELGFSILDSSGKAKGLSEIVGDLTKSLEGETEAQKVATLGKLVGTEAVSGFLALMEAGPAEIDKMSASLRDSGGASQEAADKMKAGIGGALENLSGAFESLTITLGDQLVPYVQAAATWLASLAEKFTNLSDGTKKFLVVGAALSAMFLLLTGPLLILVGFIPSIISGFTAIASVFGVTAGVLASTIGTILGVVAAVVAIGIAIYQAYQHIDWFRNMVDEAWAWIKEAFQIALEFIKGIVETVLSEVSEFIGGKLEEIRAFWDENGSAIMKLAEFYFKAIQTYIIIVMGVIKTVFQTVWPIISGIVQVAWALIQSVIGTAITAILGIISATMKLLQGDWEGAWKSIKKTASTIMNNIVSYFEDIDLVQIGKNIIQGLINGIGSMAGAVASKVSELASLVPDGIKSFLHIKSPSRVLKKLGEYTGEGFQIGIASMISSVKKTAGQMADAAVPSVSTSYGVPVGAGAGVQAAMAGDNYSGSTQTVNFERMFEGATFNVRSDTDIKSVARELYTLQESAKRRKGVR